MVALWLSRAAAGLAVSLPLFRAVAQGGVGRLAVGDRAIFEPGALWLTELVVAESGALKAGLEASLLLALLALVFLSLPSALLFTTASSKIGFAEALRRACAQVPRWLGVGAAQILVSGIILTLAALLASGPSRFLADYAPEPVADAAGLVVLAAGLGATALLAIFFDLVRVALVLNGRTREALRRALQAFGSAKGQLVGGFVFASGLGVLLIAFGARLTELFAVDRPGALRPVGAAALHAAILLAQVRIEVFWIRRLALVVEVSGAQLGRGADSPSALAE